MAKQTRLKALGGEMCDMTPVSKDSPLMIEWEEFKARGEYANAVNWGTYPSASIEMSEDGKGEVGITLHYDHIEGSMWAAFCAGWNARSEKGRLENACVLCGHNDVASDGLCAEIVPLIDREPHGGKRCRCSCQFSTETQPQAMRDNDAQSGISQS